MQRVTTFLAAPLIFLSLTQFGFANVWVEQLVKLRIPLLRTILIASISTRTGER